MNYGEKIKELRIENNLTQDKLAEILKIARITYSHYEVQEKIIPLERLNELSEFYNVSLDYIFNFNNIKKYEKSTKEINKEIISKRLKDFRKENKITQTQLAKQLNIGNGTLAGYEVGSYLISTHVLYTICKKYNISADYLLGKIDNPKYLK